MQEDNDAAWVQSLVAMANISVPVHDLSVQLSADAPVKTTEHGLSTWDLLPCERTAWDLWLLASTWPTPCCDGHSASKPVIVKSYPLYMPLCLPNRQTKNAPKCFGK